jgi:hypothetical protein
VIRPVSARRPTVQNAVMAIAVVITLAVVSCSSASASRQPFTPDLSGIATARHAPAIPRRGAYFGARVNLGDTSQAGQVAALDLLQRQLGRRLDIVHTYLTWLATFPSPTDAAALAQHSLLLLSWTGTNSSAVASGTDDRLIRKRAREIKATGKPIFLEWRWEMNRPNLRSVVGTPGDFIAAWKHVRAIFAQEHVNNVAWVWCPTAKGFQPGGNAAAYYPGDREVNWICTDAYPGFGPYRSFSTTVQPFLSWASHHRKPVMIGEYGVPLRYGPQQRAQWLREAAQTVRRNPQIKAFVYFDVDPLSAPGDGFALEPNSPALQAFRAMAGSRYFNPPGRGRG